MRTKSSLPALSATQEDYLRAIYLLCKSDGDTTVTDIATRLKLSKSTVSERLKELANSKLVIAPPYGKVSMSKQGAELGEKLTYKHRLLEVFLHQTLKIPKELIHEEAEKLEHALSDEVAKRLEEFLDNPTHDPHGSKIPSIKS